jgi:tetratricopeptide (TPR) repeat protein
MLNLALAHIKREDYVAAKPLLERVDRGSSRSPQSQELLAACHLHIGEVAAALAVLETLPRSPSVLFLLGTGYLKSDQKPKADAAFQELLSTAATPAQAHFLLGKAYAESALLEQAAAEFGKAAELDPSLPRIEVELAQAYIGLRDHEKAERSLRLALEKKPEGCGSLVLPGRADDAGRQTAGGRAAARARPSRPARRLGRPLLPGSRALRIG